MSYVGQKIPFSFKNVPFFSTEGALFQENAVLFVVKGLKVPFTLRTQIELICVVYESGAPSL